MRRWNLWADNIWWIEAGLVRDWSRIGFESADLQWIDGSFWDLHWIGRVVHDWQFIGLADWQMGQGLSWNWRIGYGLVMDCWIGPGSVSDWRIDDELTDWFKVGIGLTDWPEIGKWLVLDWHIGLGMAEWQQGLALEWHIVENWFSESSSVETLRSDPYSTGSLN